MESRKSWELLPLLELDSDVAQKTVVIAKCAQEVEEVFKVQHRRPASGRVSLACGADAGSFAGSEQHLCLLPDGPRDPDSPLGPCDGAVEEGQRCQDSG